LTTTIKKNTIRQDGIVEKNLFGHRAGGGKKKLSHQDWEHVTIGRNLTETSQPKEESDNTRD